ncbi:hypothetical protein GQ53DRAFT_755505 [Thozetella sp. PMI_491]|nr:hypothetical protein GQ53DRAFT_755505 [Thozetella sp. PMI_491]
MDPRKRHNRRAESRLYSARKEREKKRSGYAKHFRLLRQGIRAKGDQVHIEFAFIIVPALGSFLTSSDSTGGWWGRCAPAAITDQPKKNSNGEGTEGGNGQRLTNRAS